MSNLPNLPESTNEEFWGDAEKHTSVNRPIEICETHTKDNWSQHNGYIDNHNGTITCKFCPWGTFLPGYMKVIEGRVKDFRLITETP